VKRQRAAGGRRSGFTLVEIMVAIGVATLLFAICTAIFVQVSRYKAGSEKLLFVTEEANGALSRIARDIEGLHVSGVAASWPSGDATEINKLAFLTATENPGRADYCTVNYYVKLDPADRKKKLYRVLSDGVPPAGVTWPTPEADSVLAEGVDRLTVSCTPDPPAGGKVPRLVTVTLQMADPDGKPPYRRFTMTVRPGSEENQ